MSLQNYNIASHNTLNSGESSDAIIAAYNSFLTDAAFPCIMAKAALAKKHISYLVVQHMACPADDQHIIQFLYTCIDNWKKQEDAFNSAVVLFRQPVPVTEAWFDQLLWQRLQALADIDALQYRYDTRVSADPMSADFSFSLKEEALYIVGLHPASSRKARQFAYPALVFNPHAQFEQLRAVNKYQKVKKAIRQRDIALSGSVNPMLQDFGSASETIQYSGQQYNNQWRCPLDIKHIPS
jgi:uncharacterized protein